jgi:hypothetical protein
LNIHLSTVHSQKACNLIKKSHDGKKRMKSHTQKKDEISISYENRSAKSIKPHKDISSEKYAAKRDKFHKGISKPQEAKPQKNRNQNAKLESRLHSQPSSIASPQPNLYVLTYYLTWW